MATERDGDLPVESDYRYYSRRITEELAAARRAITPAAQLRHRQLAENYARKLCELGPRALPVRGFSAVGRPPGPSLAALVGVAAE